MLVTAARCKCQDVEIARQFSCERLDLMDQNSGPKRTNYDANHYSPEFTNPNPATTERKAADNPKNLQEMKQDNEDGTDHLVQQTAVDF